MPAVKRPAGVAQRWISGNVHYICRHKKVNKPKPTLALKTRGNSTRNPKQGNQCSPPKRTCVHQKFKKNVCLEYPRFIFTFSTSAFPLRWCYCYQKWKMAGSPPGECMKSCDMFYPYPSGALPLPGRGPFTLAWLGVVGITHRTG